MGFKVVGEVNGRPYRSNKTFRTQEAAVKYGYELTYNPSGNTKRKTQLTNWYIISV